MEGLVFKDTVVLCRWDGETRKFPLTKGQQSKYKLCYTFKTDIDPNQPFW